MKRYYTAKEQPMHMIINLFPNDGTFSFGTEPMFFYIIEFNHVRTKDVMERKEVADFIKEHDYIGVEIDYIGTKLIHIPVFEKKSTALSDYDRAMGIIGKRTCLI